MSSRVSRTRNAEETDRQTNRQTNAVHHHQADKYNEQLASRLVTHSAPSGLLPRPPRGASFPSPVCACAGLRSATLAPAATLFALLSHTPTYPSSDPVATTDAPGVLWRRSERGPELVGALNGGKTYQLHGGESPATSAARVSFCVIGSGIPVTKTQSLSTSSCLPPPHEDSPCLLRTCGPARTRPCHFLLLLRGMAGPTRRRSRLRPR